MKNKNFIVKVIVICFSIFSIFSTVATYAEEQQYFGFSLSPMTQSIVLTPGDVYNGSFKIVNPNSNDQDLIYKIETRSFYVDDEYTTTFDDVNSSIVEWTTLNSSKNGTLKPNSDTTVSFSIKVPDDATAGGQYLAFRVMSQPSAIEGGSSNAAVIQEQLVITHLIFAEIAGETVRNGTIENISVPSFLTSGNITAESMVKNTGNIHGTAKYKLQVFPLFSDEELYTNEEKPDDRIILPDRTLYNVSTWKETPSVGIFNVVYTVEFGGVTAQMSKLVIVCPIWLMVLALVIIVAVIAGIVFVIKRGKNKKVAAAE